MFKKFDIKHWLAVVACAGVVGAFAVIPAIKPFESIALSVAAPLFLYAGITLPQAGFGAKKDGAS